MAHIGTDASLDMAGKAEERCFFVDAFRIWGDPVCGCLHKKGLTSLGSTLGPLSFGNFQKGLHQL